jgi:hypothetical protein
MKQEPFKNFLRAVRNSLPRPRIEAPPFFERGFHGDKYLLGLVDAIIPRVEAFIETGTFNGSTIAYVARTYPSIRCLSCEPDKQLFHLASEATRDLPNVTLYNESSKKFISRLERRNIKLDRTLFWLDAHGPGFRWPLQQEIAFITSKFKSAFVLVDDFKVPALPCFGFDVWEDQECSFEYIKEFLNDSRTYRLFYPNYTDCTSDYQPSLRGWALIEFGHLEPLAMPETLSVKVRQVSLP